MNVATKAEPEAVRWQDQVYDLLRRHDVTQFAYVPDAAHRLLIDRSLADLHAQSVALTTEQEGVALLAGADLASGGRLLREGNGTAFVLLRVKPTEPPAVKCDLEPARCRVRFRLALPAPA